MRENHMYSIVLILLWISAGLTKELCVSNQTVSYVKHIISIYGNSSKISTQQLQDTFQDFTGQQNFYDICRNSSEKSCTENKCLSLDDILRLHGYIDVSDISHQGLVEISPALLHNYNKCRQNRRDHESSEGRRHKKPSSMASWGYGFLFVTIINICSLAGVVVLPFMKKTFYIKLLIFMVALAVGSLAGSGLLVLIPEAFGFLQDPEGDHSYLWKAVTIAGGVYLFFMIERILKIILDVRKRKPRKKFLEGTKDYSECKQLFIEEKNRDETPNESYIIPDRSSNMPSIKTQTPTTDRQKYSDTSTLQTDSLKHTTESQQELKASFYQGSEDTLCTLSKDKNLKKLENGSSSSEDEPVVIQQERGEVKTIAWMIIIGDGLHNFLDGLAIGAAFTDSIFAGMSISLAVICEELPHELGDFAILLNSGMTVKKALMYNFLSACMCYLGLVFGTILGANTTAHLWIFAIAGGMFLYISLVDMMPEMNSAAENEDYKAMFGTAYIFVIQNVGMLFGFGVIFLMALYGTEIDLEG
ncbi:metal cation symporter ZIP14-like isoform X2 [Ostrea edulis]|uniref:metal cation symporter ZIP14-like isoform X2 n=1 Tax=Ostrea edulis TaxID=37623 RepID=UPI002095D2EE|nr:metal cation symporter ZIP14-like isoform X2 [Ostrea edulis]